MRALLGEVRSIDSGGSRAHIGHGSLRALENELQQQPASTQYFILCDDTTAVQCLPELRSLVPRLGEAELLTVPAGEPSKSLSCCQQLWSDLADQAADRNAVLVNLGGGVVSDLGGFVSATYKRGIRFINVPTTLMGMVDAAIGGKTGIDMAGIKNIVGAFHHPLGTYVHVPFLRTLGKRELLNGVAEMLKHALVYDPDHWKAIKAAPLHDIDALLPLIERSIAIKAAVVKEDPQERGIRKLLNFGHTIGHGIEAFSWEGPHRALLHGEAIALGMICEAWLSWRMGLLEREAYDDICEFLFTLYRPYPLDSTGHHRILELMRNDKKNAEGQFRLTLLTAIGKGQIDVRVSASQVQEALEHYRSMVQMMKRVEG
jgi:3-dehydroquinate synthase